MLKKILTFFVLYFVLFISSVSSASISVDRIFSDIDKDYKYLDELQVLYDRGMIFPDENWKFNPKKLLTRDEFVGVAEEASCNKCMRPRTVLEYLERYSEKPFFDVEETNKNFYCISYGKEAEHVIGYNPWDTCDDWTNLEWEVPFCVNNYINLEETLAVIMRMSWILTIDEAILFENRFNSWEVFNDLALDLKVTNEDGGFYSFYPYFERALDYKLLEYDNYWNQIIYNLLEKEGDYLRPKKNISKEEFLQIAYIVLKSGSCRDLEDKDLSISINVYDKSCDESKSVCEKSDLNDDKNIYDFEVEVWWACELWIDDNKYIWRFYNDSTWEEIKRYSKYIDNYQFLWAGRWYIFLRVIDKCWWTGEVFFTQFIKKTANTGDINELWWNLDGLWLGIIADKVYWDWPLKVSFDVIVKWWDGSYTYIWDFWDDTKWYWSNPTHTFREPGVYEVIVKVRDDTWLKSESTIIIRVVDWWGILWLWLDIIADNISWDAPLKINFESIIEGWEWPYIYEWDFWDGSNGTDDNPTHIYTKPWIYEVDVRVTDSNWLYSDSTMVIKVFDWWDDQWLWLDINVDNVYWEAPLEVNFESIVEGWKWPYTYEWDFLDWIIGTDANPTHIFIEAGTYEVEVRVTDSNWLYSDSTVAIKVFDWWDDQWLWLNINVDNVYWESPLEVNFESIVEGWEWPYTYEWNFWDWIIETDANPTHIFIEAGTYEVLLNVTDSNGIESEVKVIIKVVDTSDNDWLSTNISWGPFVWEGPLEVNFESTVEGWEWPYIYEWDFWDWENWIWEYISRIYKEEGVYDVLLTTSDSNWLVSTSSVLVKVTETIDCEGDTDNDWVNDCEDKCFSIPWDIDNWGCPIFYLPENLLETWTYLNCLNIDGKTWIIEGNAICNTCPCSYYFDFISNLRECDLIFPAIVSPEGKTIYSKWDFYEIR